MSKKLMFDLTVESNGLYCANAEEWFVKATLGNEDLSYFRQVPNAKEKTKLGVLTFTNPVREFGCTFSATPSDLDAITIEPCKLSVMSELCQDDLESSFVSQWMRAGSNQADFAPANFMAHYYEVLANKVKDQLALIAWQGDTSNTVLPYSLCDGLEKKLLADGAVIDVAATTLTAANILEKLAEVKAALPASISYKTSELIIWMGPAAASLYQQAASIIPNASISEAYKLAYQGIQIVIAPGMSANTMVATLGMNLVYAYDLLGDVSEINTINMKLTTGDATIRTRTDFKFWVGFTNPEEIVFYN